MDQDNQIQFKYFEKPTTTNTTIRRSTAMAENAKVQSLSNDLVRRLLNTMDQLLSSYKAEVVNGYGAKLRTSGYSLDQTRRILCNGMKGYRAKVARRGAMGIRLYRTAGESVGTRFKKKLLSKSNWYKGRRNGSKAGPLGAGGEGTPGLGGTKVGTAMGTKKGGKVKKGTTGGNKNLKTRAVLFVDQTPNGELAKLIREQIQTLEPVLGYRLRVVERTGRNLLSHFPQTKTWSGVECGISECITCNQGGEEIPNCTRASVVYESICSLCNPGVGGKGELKKVKEGPPSLYVGESSRSIQERASEHWGAARRGEEESHMVRHQKLVHPGAPPQFHFKVVSSHRTALNRQIREAVRIRRRGGSGSILNSKSEFNRCHIPRLVVEEEDEEKRKKRLEKEKLEKEETGRMLDTMEMTWEERKTSEREQALKKRRHTEGGGGEEN